MRGIGEIGAAVSRPVLRARRSCGMSLIDLVWGAVLAGCIALVVTLVVLT
jgi:hypothetical protein